MKKRINRLGLISLSLSAAFLASTGYCENIRFITEPTTSMDTAGRSFSNESELTRELIRRLKQTNDIEVYPWKRAYSIMQNQPNVALFPTTRTAARENDAKWVGTANALLWDIEADRDYLSDIKIVYTIDTKYLYYALSKDTPDETVNLLQETLNTMKKEGVYYKYYKNSFSEDTIREFSKIENPLFPWMTSNKK